MIAVRNMRSHHAIPRTAPSLPTAKPLPDRRDDGLYSVLGAARRFGVSRDVIRLWIARDLVRCSRDPRRAHGPSGFTSTTRPSCVSATLPRIRAVD